MCRLLETTIRFFSLLFFLIFNAWADGGPFPTKQLAPDTELFVGATTVDFLRLSAPRQYTGLIWLSHACRDAPAGSGGEIDARSARAVARGGRRGARAGLPDRAGTYVIASTCCYIHARSLCGIDDSCNCAHCG